MTFKIGERVRYCSPYAEGGKADFGTIVSRYGDSTGSWWVDWDNGERLFAQDIHLELIDAEQSEIDAEQSEIDAEQTEISASISSNKLSVKQLKDLLNRMDDSIQLSFTDLKIHFG